MPLPRRVAFLPKRGFFTNTCEEPEDLSRRPVCASKRKSMGFRGVVRKPAAPAGPEFSKCPASGLRIKTEIKGFPGSRTQTGGGGRAGILKVPGARFAHQNRNQRGSGESYANRRRRPGRNSQSARHPVCASKPKSKGFRGVVRKPAAPAGPEFSKCPALGLCIKTEIKGVPGSRTQTGGGRAGILKVPGAGFAHQNRNQWVSGESYANRRRRPGLQASGSRSACTKKAAPHQRNSLFLYLNY